MRVRARSRKRSGGDRGDVDLLYVAADGRTSRGSSAELSPPGPYDGDGGAATAAAHRLGRRRRTSGSSPTARRTRPSSSAVTTRRRIVTANLRASRLTILYGPSGVGKTSLLQAGVVHDLRRSRSSRTRRPGPSRRRSRSARSATGATTRCRRLMDAMHAPSARRSGGDRSCRAGSRASLCRRDAARLDAGGAHAARRPRPVRGLLPLPRRRGAARPRSPPSFRRSSTSRTCA